MLRGLAHEHQNGGRYGAGSGSDPLAGQGGRCRRDGLPHVPDESRGLPGQDFEISGETLAVTVLYLPQLLGLALGLSEQEVRLDLNLAVTAGFQQKMRHYEPVPA